MTESVAAVAFYLGLGALLLGAVRVARARIEGQPRDRLGLTAIALALACFAIAVAIFARGPKGVLPF
jgi:hypothetical protein